MELTEKYEVVLTAKYDTLEQKERRRRCFEAARDPNISSAKGCAQRLKGHSNLFCEELFYMYYVHTISHPTTSVLHTYMLTIAQSGLRANVLPKKLLHGRN